MAVYHNYLAVVGRIPYDEEDSCLFFNQLTEEQARIEFAKQMLKERYGENAETAQRNFIKEHGGDLGVFINYVFVSESPIEPL